MSTTLQMPIGRCDYRGGAPNGYQCGKCGAVGVKLWRGYSTFLENQSLLCLNCACADQKEQRTPTEDDQSLYTGKVFHFYHAAGMRDGEGWGYDPSKGTPANADRTWEHKERHDSIGWLVPAVPTEDGETFWGYSSVPQPGCEWWYRLPTRPAAIAPAAGEANGS